MSSIDFYFSEPTLIINWKRVNVLQITVGNVIPYVAKAIHQKRRVKVEETTFQRVEEYLSEDEIYAPPEITSLPFGRWHEQKYRATFRQVPWKMHSFIETIFQKKLCELLIV